MSTLDLSIRRFMSTKGLKSKHPWVFAVVLGLLWASVRALFAHLQASLEIHLVDNGLAVFWWLIVLTYFVVDLSMLLVLVYFVGRRMPKGFPFWYFSMDIAVFVFLMHASSVCLDNTIYFQLSAIGLQYAFLVFGIAATLWTVFALMRHHSMKKRFSHDSSSPN